jgi:hypothetical protein
MSAVRITLAAIAAALLTTAPNGSASAQKKGKDPRSWGEWIADVERPAAGKSKNIKAKGRTRGGLADEGQMENLRVQQKMQRYQQSTTMQSSVAKKQDATKKEMVKKMK